MIKIVGSGPGDPELITVKGKKALEEADIVIYAGSLVNPEILKYCRKNCNKLNSASMHLEEIIKVMADWETKGKNVVRLHTGDPSIYGAVREQMDRLDELGIKYEIVPGVSSFCAAAAALKKELTLPGVSQSVIITRMEGRTTVPKGQEIESYAKHRATLIIFLSVHMIDKIVEKLTPYYGENTPVAVVYKASWPEQEIIRGTLLDISQSVKKMEIKKTALIAVGDFLGNDYELSKLYDKKFSHEYREALK